MIQHLFSAPSEVMSAATVVTDAVHRSNLRGHFQGVGAPRIQDQFHTSAARASAQPLPKPLTTRTPALSCPRYPTPRWLLPLTPVLQLERNMGITLIIGRRRRQRVMLGKSHRQPLGIRRRRLAGTNGARKRRQQAPQRGTGRKDTHQIEFMLNGEQVTFNGDPETPCSG